MKTESCITQLRIELDKLETLVQAARTNEAATPKIAVVSLARVREQLDKLQACWDGIKTNEALTPESVTSVDTVVAELQTLVPTSQEIGSMPQS